MALQYFKIKVYNAKLSEMYNLTTSKSCFMAFCDGLTIKFNDFTINDNGVSKIEFSGSK